MAYSKGQFGKGHVDHSGPFDASLAVVGEAPGTRELEFNAPMVGPTGMFVNRALGGDARRAETFVTNASRCLPYDNERDPVPRIAYYSGALARDFVRLTSCKTLLLLGAEATRAVLGLSGIANYHGSTFTRAEVDALRGFHSGEPTLVPVLPPFVHTVVCSLHPAYAMRGMPQFKPGISTVIRRARNWSLSDKQSERYGQEAFTLQPTVSEFAAFCENIIEASIDVETSRKTGEILMCGVASDTHVMVVPWTGEYIAIVGKLLQSSKLKIGHNFVFDEMAFNRYGLDTAPPVWNTIDAGALLWPPNKERTSTGKRRAGAKWLSLASCVLRACDGVPYWKRVDLPDTAVTYSASYPWCEPGLYEALYCGLDCLYTMKLKVTQAALLEREGML